MRLRFLAAATAMFAFSLAAHADSFNFSFGTAGVTTFNGSGTLTGSLVSANTYLITGITGTTNTGNGTDRPIDGVLAVGTFFGNDNLLTFTNGAFTFDAAGLSYSLRNGAEVNLYSSNSEILERVGGNTVSQTAPITITAATPEPSSLALLGTGVLGVVGAARRRFAAA